MRGKQIMTVTGPVNANLLGTVYSHEHLIVQPQIPDEKYIAALSSSVISTSGLILRINLTR